MQMNSHLISQYWPHIANSTKKIKIKQTTYNEHMRFLISFNTKYLRHKMIEIEKMNVESGLKQIVQWQQFPRLKTGKFCVTRRLKSLKLLPFCNHTKIIIVLLLLIVQTVTRLHRYSMRIDFGSEKSSVLIGTS
jgi:hypothetical protein